MGGLTSARTGHAAVLATLGMALIGLIDNYVRLIAVEAGLWQFHLTRAAMAFPLLWLLARVMGGRLTPRRLQPVLLRSLFNSVAMLVYFGCLSVLPIGQVVASLFTAPLFVALISAWLFRQRVGMAKAAAALLGFAGILLIVGPEQGQFGLVSALPVLSGLLYALANLATQHWCRDEHPLTLIAGFFALMALWGALGLAGLALLAPEPVPGAAGFVTRGWVAPSGLFLGLTLLQAVGTIAGIGMIIRAYQIAPAPLVAVFEYSLLVFAALWAWVIWSEVPAPAALWGMAAVALAGGLVLLPERGAR